RRIGPITELWFSYEHRFSPCPALHALRPAARAHAPRAAGRGDRGACPQGARRHEDRRHRRRRRRRRRHRLPPLRHQGGARRGGRRGRGRAHEGRDRRRPRRGPRSRRQGASRQRGALSLRPREPRGLPHRLRPRRRAPRRDPPRPGPLRRRRRRDHPRRHRKRRLQAGTRRTGRAGSRRHGDPAPLLVDRASGGADRGARADDGDARARGAARAGRRRKESMMYDPGAHTAPAEGIDQVHSAFDTTYTWDYGVTRQELRNLYEKAKRDQWNAADQLAWSTPVDPEAELVPDFQIPVYGTHSQFMHGEQGALLATAQIVDATPSFDAKLYGATQVMDEGRHVEVYARYLREKLTRQYPVNRHLKQLLDLILGDARWDMKYLGMQIMVEGLAMAAFGYLHQVCQEPLLTELTRYVM